MAALSGVIAIGQSGREAPVLVTVPLRQADQQPSQKPCVSVSADGRFVAFVSAARLVAEDADDRDDIYVLDRETGGVSLETAGDKPVVGNRPIVSAAGRLLVFEGTGQVLLIRDRASGAVRPLQRGREPPNGPSRDPSISADGRYVAFASAATNLVDGPDANGPAEDVFLADTASMTFRRVSNATGAPPGNVVSSFAPDISDDGRFVAFSSTRPLDAAKLRTINTYLFDAQTGATTTISVTASGRPPNGSSYGASISGDGRYVAFVSEASNLVRRHGGSSLPQIYVRDMVAKTTELVSRSTSAQPGNGRSRHPVLSADGQIVVFQSDASDLTCGGRCPASDRDINLVADIFRHDRRTGVTELISRAAAPWMEASIGPAADRTGTIVAFLSRHPLDQADDRHDYDLFVWAREVRR